MPSETHDEQPVVIIDGFRESTGEPRRVILLARYEGKDARITIPEAKPGYADEPGVEVYRRELRALLAVLQEAVDSPQGIRWPYYPRASQS